MFNFAPIEVAADAPDPRLRELLQFEVARQRGVGPRVQMARYPQRLVDRRPGRREPVPGGRGRRSGVVVAGLVGRAGRERQPNEGEQQDDDA